ncbi:hypothetical protein RP20_CCG024242 [Aedes albopictus]|nr:hypothetical protein RP20_CCG024242 [Aedes albopictus]
MQESNAEPGDTQPVHWLAGRAQLRDDVTDRRTESAREPALCCGNLALLYARESPRGSRLETRESSENVPHSQCQCFDRSLLSFVVVERFDAIEYGMSGRVALSYASSFTELFKINSAYTPGYNEGGVRNKSERTPQRRSTTRN